MEEKIDAQANIIQQQQKYLESLDLKLGVPDDGESLDGATDDAAKIKRVLAKAGDDPQVRSHRRLGRHNETSGRKRPILFVKNGRGYILSRQPRRTVLKTTVATSD
ncbi:hypothetical protein E2C01_061763 [Portunus trituberculatus]|uniref:Uncharacterized protein n=1 Tax=Portunus trituberculatus TaxID=210409 RepID=A0A5B7HE62_PORTR|nr:hypothetical protein [Portunus trituberculatus]